MDDKQCTSTWCRAAGEAVQAAVKEVLTNSELQRHLRPASPSSDSPARLSQRLMQTMSQLLRWTVGQLKSLFTATSRAARRLGQKSREMAGPVIHARAALAHKAQHGMQVALGRWRIRLAWLARLAGHLAKQRGGRLGRGGVLAVGVGIIAGTGCYLAGPLVASALSGLYGALLTLVATRLRRHPLGSA